MEFKFKAYISFTVTMEAPTLCIFQIYSLRLGLLCILDYNKMLPLLPENISED